MDKIYLWLLLLISCSCSHTKEKVSNDMDSSLCVIDVMQNFKKFIFIIVFKIGACC